jgi:hypothetical protein
VSEPVSRSLAAVLRAKLQDPAPLRLMLGECVAASGNAYATVELGGESTTIPRLAGAPVVAGAAAYVLASRDFLLFLGACSTADAGGGGSSTPGVYGAPRAPTGADGADGDWWVNTATGAFQGPKSSGAWPAPAWRLMPMAPTYAQLKGS